MKKIKVSALFLAYMFLLVTLPINPLIKAVSVNAEVVATEGGADYSNNYNLIKADGDLFGNYTTTYKNYDLLFSNNKVAIIKDGAKVDNGVLDAKLGEYLVAKSGDEVYTSDFRAKNPSIKSINLVTGKTASIAVSAATFKNANDAVADKKDNLWFTSAYPNYYLLRVDTKTGKTVKVKPISKNHYGFSDPICDKNNNIYFASGNQIFKAQYEKSKITYKKYQISGIKDYQYWRWRDFKIDNSGNLWVMDNKNNIAEFKLSGSVYKKAATYNYPKKDVSRFTMDESGNVWVMTYSPLIGAKYTTADIYKLENGTFAEKYKVGGIVSQPGFEVVNDNRLLVYDQTYINDGDYNWSAYMVYTSIAK